jgi:hypothetical protein
MRTKVTDSGLKELAGLQELRELSLRFSPITDVGLKELVGLKSLRKVEIGETKVTDAGVAELQKALPDCKIER